jgi:hypothetical protein
MSERPAEAVIWDALRGGLVTRALALVADLRIAHALAGGPRSVVELARETHADADTLTACSARSRATASSPRSRLASSATRPPPRC